ncbi:DTW domain-containing protein 2 [Bienertia sinuspersici]
MEEEETTAEQQYLPDLPPTTRRRICTSGCDRPINHPHEQRQKLATVPLLKKCLDSCEIIVGRKLRLGSSLILDSLYHGRNDSNEFAPFRHALVLFPGAESMPSIEINEWKSSSNSVCIDGCILIVFDGTWKHAKEMVYASLPFLSNFATCIYFDCDYEVGGGSIYDSDLILKKEPYKGCMNTMEAVARALRVLEPSGVEIEAKLVEILKSMVRLQACYLKPMKPRKKLLKKGMEQKNTIDAGDVMSTPSSPCIIAYQLTNNIWGESMMCFYIVMKTQKQKLHSVATVEENTEEGEEAFLTQEEVG